MQKSQSQQLWGEFYGADMESENIENSKKSSKTKTKIIDKRESKKMILHPLANFRSASCWIPNVTNIGIRFNTWHTNIIEPREWDMNYIKIRDVNSVKIIRVHRPTASTVLGRSVRPKMVFFSKIIFGLRK